MTIIKQFVKDPDADVDYGLDLSSWVETSESIIQATVELSGTLMTVDDPPNIVDNKVFSRIAGGQEGERSTIRFGFTKNNGETDFRTIMIEIEKR